ncbi:fumarylacetoacetate hydrolase family protein [Microbacterium sp. A93]|uniref:fumarylacetoacetate hydrolase family protein n=1 Tax=Microbacterium sp. A93 TaxID=3450716 RepID=UPI003F423132
MKIARWTHGDRLGEGFVVDGGVAPFPDGGTVAEVLTAGLPAATDLFDRLDPRSAVPRSEVSLLAPLVPAAVRDFAVFEEHVEGMSADENGQPRVGEAWYESPTFYFTNPHQIFGTGQQITPPATERLDFELEVAVVVGGVAGRPGTDLDTHAAAEHIFGYTIMNDWSARDIQAAEMRGHLGPAKGKDFATSLGPWIVTADEMAGYLTAEGFLAVRAEVYVNDALVGEDLVSNMAWTFPELLVYASRASRVVPGDVLGSGTVGNGGCLGELWGKAGGELVPPPLQEGDTVRMVVEGLGELSGSVGPSRAPHPLPPARSRPLPRARHRTG